MNVVRKVSRMTPKREDPYIGVHALSEFVYCPRAGVLAFEQQSEEPNDEVPNLWRLPRWSLSRIERRFSALTFQLLLLLIIAAILIAVVTLWNSKLPAAVSLACAIAVLVIARRITVCARAAVVLHKRRRMAIDAIAHEPDAHGTEPERASWWSLLKAGFESIAYKDALRDEEWKLVGRPWRVLRKGALRIPVFVTQGDATLRRQHLARMAAYCHLLLRCEGAESPYGVVIERDSYQGWTVPNTARSRKAFHDALVMARCVMREVQMGRLPVAPDSPRVCRACPLGKPFVHRPGKTEVKRNGYVLPVKGRRGVDGRIYHSACGDRFGWAPPHEKAFVKRLI